MRVADPDVHAEFVVGLPVMAVHVPEAHLGLRSTAATEGVSMASSLTRRDLLARSAAGGLGIVFAGSLEAIAGPAHAATRSSVGYGPLVTDPAGILALPAGFSYKIIAQTGVTLLESGQPTPSDPDGAAVFASASGATLIYNHEIAGSELHWVPRLPGLTYDPGAGGGTTNVDVDADSDRIREYVSLAGTFNNCAGGRTPWGTWLTCEETEQRANTTYQKDHGYVFEVHPFDRAANTNPIALKYLGRYAHEAVAVDPQTFAIYLTEDATAPNGLYFRWTPPAGFTGGKGSLRALAARPGGDTAGKLQAMSCYLGSNHIPDLAQATRPGTRYKVDWVDVPDRDARTTSVRMQQFARPITRSRKLEGAWWGDGGAYFVASFARTSDGSAEEHDGQVWHYDPATQTVTLKTIFGVNPDPASDTNYDGPDNITVSPYGGVILAEDGEGIQHLIGVTDQGKAYPLARNQISGGEFTGPTFSADGRTLFACIQMPGYVFAITGPWGRPSNARP
jgi:secreted PhoX family phosphatase